MSLATITLFVYNRPDHAQQTVAALKLNHLAQDSDLIVYADGAKNVKDEVGVNEVRAYLRTITGFKSLKIVEKEKNNGLAKSIISGVTEVVKEHGKIIVVEDDLITSPYFLQYMNEGLDVYEKEDKVISLSGYVYPVDGNLPEIFFLRGADCWGWATWQRGWALFEANGQKLLDQLKKERLTKEFDFNNSQSYVKMLVDQIKGKNNSWAIRWYASAFLNNKLTLYPGQTLVKNIGLDGSGTHCGFSKEKFDLSTKPVNFSNIPVAEDRPARTMIAEYFKSNRLSLFKKILTKGWWVITSLGRKSGQMN